MSLDKAHRVLHKGQVAFNAPAPLSSLHLRRRHTVPVANHSQGSSENPRRYSADPIKSSNRPRFHTSSVPPVQSSIEPLRPHNQERRKRHEYPPPESPRAESLVPLVHHPDRRPSTKRAAQDAPHRKGDLHVPVHPALQVKQPVSYTLGGPPPAGYTPAVYSDINRYCSSKPAFSRSVSGATLVGSGLPKGWKCHVKPECGKPYVTVTDVVNAWVQFLHEPIVDYVHLNALQSDERDSVLCTYRERVDEEMRKYVGSPGRNCHIAKSWPMRRVDFLQGRSRFLGIQQDPQTGKLVVHQV